MHIQLPFDSEGEETIDLRSTAKLTKAHCLLRRAKGLCTMGQQTVHPSGAAEVRVKTGHVPQRPKTKQTFLVAFPGVRARIHGRASLFVVVAFGGRYGLYSLVSWLYRCLPDITSIRPARSIDPLV